MSIPALLFWAIAAVALFAPDVVALYLFICTAPFGAMNTLPPGVGGVNLLPQSVAALVLGFRAFTKPNAGRVVLASLATWRGFALLAAFVIYAVLSGIILPHIFQGQVDVIPMDSATRQPLAPTGANFNQSAYLVVDLISALALFLYLRGDRPGDASEKLMDATLWCGGLYVVTGLLEWSDIAPAVVESFRNASYTIFQGDEIAGVRRIAGFFSEASAYGPRCVMMGALLFFGRFAFRSSLKRDWIAPGLGVVLIAMAALSTSSTAFVGIFMFGLLILFRLGMRVYQRKSLGNVRFEIGVLAFLGAVLGGAWFVQPDLLITPVLLLNALVFHKAESGSFYERSMWNHVGKMDFAKTYGLGVGAGGTRTSNWGIALLSNTGFIGFALMIGYLGVVFTRAGSAVSNRSAAMARGAKYALATFLISQLASGTNIDPGLNLPILTVMVLAGSRWADSIGVSRRSRKSGRSPEDAGGSSGRRSSRAGGARPRPA